jgi:hypothetical protein
MNTANEEMLFKNFEMYGFNKHNTIQAKCDADFVLRSCLRFDFIHQLVHSCIPPEARSSHLVLLEPKVYGKHRGWYYDYQVCDKRRSWYEGYQVCDKLIGWYEGYLKDQLEDLKHVGRMTFWRM